MDYNCVIILLVKTVCFFLFSPDVCSKYSMYLQADIKTKVISGTRNLAFNKERRVSFGQCPPEVRNS